ncbi:hypothetical protein AB0D66_22230 [Streptomyces sp. NPDC048270]|uniref:hypothetical protein n=1 Tax=Streptomyces sp. NPDC048270 TaxID=3154615 RepID=UPI0033C7B5A9
MDNRHEVEKLMGELARWFSPGAQRTGRLTRSLLRDAQEVVGRLLSELGRAEQELKSLRGTMEVVGRMRPPVFTAGGSHVSTAYADGYLACLADLHAAVEDAAGEAGRLQVDVREGDS